MLKFWQQFVVLSVVVCLVGCQTLTTIQQPRHATVLEKVRLGDTVTISMKDRTRLILRVAEISDKAIAGTTAGKRISIPFEQIQTIEIKRTERGKSIGAITGGVVVAAVAAIALISYVARAFFFGD